ncbi:MAG: universal stress protein [Acidimicrobiales bacterium]|nr:universal stress protein [Acidimicrobiales bacterium]
MNRKIIVALDSSSGARSVLEWTLDQADSTDEVIALSVWNVTLLGGLENPFANLHDAQVEAAARVNRLVEAVSRSRWDNHRTAIPVRVDVRHGDPVAELVDASNDADLIVLGNAHHSGLGELGSVARAVIRGAQCAVAMVPTDDEETVGATS